MEANCMESNKTQPTNIKSQSKFTEVNKTFLVTVIGAAAAIGGCGVQLPSTFVSLREWMKGDGIPQLTVKAEDGPNKLPPNVTAPTDSAYGWYSDIEIKNGDKTDATNVRILWEGKGVAKIKDVQGKLKDGTLENYLELGDIPAGTGVKVELWTARSHTPYSVPSISYSGTRVPLFDESLRTTNFEFYMFSRMAMFMALGFLTPMMLFGGATLIRKWWLQTPNTKPIPLSLSSHDGVESEEPSSTIPVSKTSQSRQCA